ncbi:BolA family transcriptional regulator [Candidatus Pelagibacter sp.]|nr:BolA family transcriptional regulator [Candidatus Pelagibacter sp.]
MNINDLIAIVKKKLINEIKIEKIEVEDKSFLHKNHSGNQEGKFHLKLKINSKELKDLNRIEGNKKIYKILDQEMKEYIHSLQILIN